MVAQWIASVASEAVVASGHGHKHGTPGVPKCSWPVQIVSPDRDLDFTECFELVVLLPAPLLLAILIGGAQVFYLTRWLRRTGPGSIDWVTRSARNERVAKTKRVSQHRPLRLEILGHARPNKGRAHRCTKC